ncbi:MAG TPA: peptidoglycan-binding protein [Brevundimonas sp.]|uniref:peptidoglycan-binding protein n=1 Tax=Brevundimonas sp. TaxID=1871086 RepID=UPI002ED842CA
MAETSIHKARRLLTPAHGAASPWAALGAAALAASAAMLMAGVMVLGPGVRFDEPPASNQSWDAGQG